MKRFVISSNASEEQHYRLYSLFNTGPAQCALCSVHSTHRRRIKTEENAKVVASVWGTEFI